MENVLVRSVATASAQSGTGEPLSAQSVVGDLAVLVMASQFGTTAAAPPAGWTVETVPSVNSRSGYTAVLRVTDPAQTQGVVWFSESPDDAARQRGVLVVLDGVEGESVIRWQEAVPALSGDATLLVSQQHGTSSAVLDEWEADDTLIWPGQASTTASWSSLRVGLVTQTPTGGSSSRAWTGVTLSVSAEPPDPTPGAYVSARVWDGAQEVEATASVWTGEREAEVLTVRPVPHGARSVDELLSTPRFIVAHRGGSASWPEGTQRAYTMAAAHGVHAMEVPVCRTTDGVWFVLHDQSLSRLGGPATDCRTMSWMQVVDAMTDVDGGSRMPARLDWVLEHYAGDFTLIVDPKYVAWSATDEYVEMLMPYRSNLMLKYAAENEDLHAVWRAAGLRTWSYAYPQYQPDAWYRRMLVNDDLDVLSMSWDASDEVWTELVATGKPVASHIPGTAEGVATGWAKGAVGAMCAMPTAVLTLKV